MNMFARFDENPAMTLQDIKETIRYGRTHRQHENSVPTTNKVWGGGGGGGGYNYRLIQFKSIEECSKGSILQYFRLSLGYNLS